MAAPSTPQKQVQRTEPEQLPTPPLTAVARKETTSIATHQHHEFGPHVRRLTYNTHVTQDIKKMNEGLDLTLCGGGVKQRHGTQSPPELTQTQHDQVRPKQQIEDQVTRLQLKKQETEEKLPGPPRNQDRPEEAQDRQALVTQQSKGKTQQLNMDGQPKNEVKLWIYSSATTEQRRQRFHSMLHALWPSNEVFNTARHPLYKSEEEDGPYEFFLTQIWDGHCPYNDDDYNPFTDPSKSTEVWQPKIGDEGIEDEQDLRMVLKARQEHRARSEALKKRKKDVVAAQLDAGVKYADIDMLQVLLGPEIESSDESDSDYDKEEGEKLSKPTIQMEAPSVITYSPETSILQPTIAAKGIRVFGGHEPSSGRPKRSKNKKGRKANKRKRAPNSNPNGTYKYDSGSEDEQLVYKKTKKGKAAARKDVVDDLAWQAQTRAAARRAQRLGMDGTYEMD
ncbi:hypothetical protein CHU98_g8771 [Xylaria longipes]|nr:hypothetical protein CHU98_g8771 [Xylaria longipes]